MSNVISVENLGKKYLLSHQTQRQPYVALRDVIAEGTATIGRRLLHPINRLVSSASSPQPQIPASEDFWALKDVSFEITDGDRVGIIGRNGAGKSTLLKILSRITEPSAGRVRIMGRVASLLEVGTGFHPELTGRENIFLNGAILGMTRTEIKKKFDEIVDFAEIEKFLDTPVKRYSSGMYVRLAFAVAAHLEPEILLIDEVLAVGDAQFQKKCLGKMEDVSKKEGRTVIFVSHQLDMIKALCSKAILLEKGELIIYSESEIVIDRYAKGVSVNELMARFEVEENHAMPIQIVSGRVVGSNSGAGAVFDVFDVISIEIEYVVRKKLYGSIVNIEVNRNSSALFISFDTDNEPSKLSIRNPGRYRSKIELPCPLLKPGKYTVSPGTGIANSTKIQQLYDALSFEVQLTSRPSTFLSYAEKRLGMIAVPIVWDTEVL